MVRYWIQLPEIHLKTFAGRNPRIRDEIFTLARNRNFEFTSETSTQEMRYVVEGVQFFSPLILRKMEDYF